MNESTADRYQRLRRRARAASAASAAVMFALVALSPAAHTLSAAARAAVPGGSSVLGSVMALVLFVALLVFLWQVAALPAHLWFALTGSIGRRGQSRRRVGTLLAGEVLGSAVVLAGAAIVGLVWLVAVGIAPGWWWLVGGLALSAGLALGLQAAPLVLTWLGPVRPLARPGLTSALEGLAARVHMPVAAIEEWVVADVGRVTALVAGVGSGRRVLVSSALARDWSDDEIAVIVAHELAHHAHGDLWRALGLRTGLLVAALWTADRAVAAAGTTLGLAGPEDLAALPLIALVAALVWTVTAPVRHAQSRAHERRADDFALAATRQREAFRSALRRLSARHLAEERPSRLVEWLFFRHPPVTERLARAEQTPEAFLRQT
jgi:STE24 endopeptidase